MLWASLVILYYTIYVAPFVIAFTIFNPSRLVHYIALFHIGLIIAVLARVYL